MNTFVLIMVARAVPLLLEISPRFPDLESCEAAFTQAQLEAHERAVPRHVYGLRCLELDVNGHAVNVREPIAPVAE